MAPRPSYYDILDLPQGEPAPSAEQVKKAYRKALLSHHPDKISERSAGRSDTHAQQVTVDEVALAYKTLSERALKAEYDRWLAANSSFTGSNATGGQGHHTGLETVDLEDLTCDEQAQAWTRDCRCGVGGYTVTEDQLEKNVEDGELIVGCEGCSLWLRVLYSVEE